GLDRLGELGRARAERFLVVPYAPQAQLLRAARLGRAGALLVDGAQLVHLRAMALQQRRGLVGDAEELLLGTQALVLLFLFIEVALRLAQLALDLALLLLGLRGIALLQGLLRLLCLGAGLREIGLAARVLALLDAAREVEDRVAHFGLLGRELSRL